MNTVDVRSSVQVMGGRSSSDLARKLGILALIAVTLLVSGLRPLARASGHLNMPPRMVRMSLLSVAAVDADAPVAPVKVVSVPVLAPLIAVLLLVLKTRRTAFRSVPLRRLKIPPRSTAAPLSSDLAS